MSYHTHNLRDGDIFSSYDLDGGHHLLEVLDVEHSLYITPAPDYLHLSGILDPKGWFMHLVARCLKCDQIFNSVVSKDVSLCMIGYGPDDGEPGFVETNSEEHIYTLDDWIRVWSCSL